MEKNKNIYLYYIKTKTMASNQMKRLNNLKWNDEYIENVKNYLKTNKVPDSLSKYQKARMKKQFKTKVLNENDEMVDEWEINDGYLVYRPKQLKVIPSNEIPDLLETAYDDIKLSLGKGLRKFYDVIKTKYLGITFNDTEEFLKKQGDYQITRPLKVKKNDQPIQATYPNQTWIIDNMYLDKYVNDNILIGERKVYADDTSGKINTYNVPINYKFLTNVIDVFSKKVWSN